MTTTIETITKETAEKWLKTNYRNRNVNAKRVNAYAHALQTGRWKLSPDPIAFSKDGALLNGQHRLLAIVKADIPMECEVRRDCPDDMVFDKGKERTVGQSLYMRGRVDKQYSSTTIIAISNAYLKFVYARYPYEDELDEFINKYAQELFDISTVSRASQTSGHKKICGRAPVQAALLAGYLNGVDIATISRFCRVANSGFAESKYDYSAIVLRREVERYNTNSTQARMRLCKFAQCALKGFAEGNSRQKAYANPQNIWIKEANDESV